MKKIVFIWTYPNMAVIPWEQVVFKKRIVSYCLLVNQYFENMQKDWSVEVDTKRGKLDELSKENYVVWLMLEGNQKRYWIYKDVLKERKDSVYYVSISDLYNGDISKFLTWLSQREEQE